MEDDDDDAEIHFEETDNIKLLTQDISRWSIRVDPVLKLCGFAIRK